MSFAHDFVHALLDGDAGSVQELAAQPAFAVYRNTVLKACADALEANFPAVTRLVGRAWLRAAALAYARSQLPQDGRLLFYGDEGFGAFLQALPSAAQLPWLQGVARLDTLWRAAHAAADAPVLPAGALAACTPEELGALVLQPHPATHWAWFDAQPVAAIWMHNRRAETGLPDLAWQGDGLLLTRTEGAVHWQALAQAGCALLDACAAGRPLGEAAQHALDIDPAADLAALLAQLLQAGAFASSLPVRTSHEHTGTEP